MKSELTLERKAFACIARTRRVRHLLISAQMNQPRGGGVNKKVWKILGRYNDAINKETKALTAALKRKGLR